ncbi:hypothetical protein [Cohnella cellulosilytica]|uniref:Alpha-L-fucosidase C-terminal domain-containing protein n=1 Tax=Cohnella cellulosilytica TaxID=986710 RepID=A0ABW2FHG4_9BACL
MDGSLLLAVWRMDDEEEAIEIPLGARGQGMTTARCIYPVHTGNAVVGWDADRSLLTVRLPQRYSARVVLLQKRKGWTG